MKKDWPGQRELLILPTTIVLPVKPNETRNNVALHSRSSQCSLINMRVRLYQNCCFFFQFLRNSPKSCGSTINLIYHRNFLIKLLFYASSKRVSMATRQNKKNGLNYATAHSRCNFFFLKMQNTQVPICSQYIILV